MKKIGLAVIICSIASLVGCSTGNEKAYSNAVDPSVDMSIREITASNGDVSSLLSDARSAVVGISVDLSDGYAVGSGVAISDKGLILTNFHVIEGGGNITLYFADKTTGKAEVLWAEPGIDMAVLKSSREIPYLETEELSSVNIGEEVYAIGTPLTLEFKHTVTKGIVSAMNRTLETESSYGTSFLQSLVQHDASINPGNSGGPLISREGKVIGINTLKASEGEGIGFAVPIELGKIVIEKIAENGSYQTPYIGIFGFDSELARVYGQTFNEQGVYVVSTDGASLKAGIKKGDLITMIDDEEIENMLDFRAAVYKKDVNDTVKIKFLRNGQALETDVKLAKRP